MPYIANTLYAVQYNGIQLSCSHIESFDSETIYSEDGVDRLYNKVTITVRGIVNGQANITGQNNGDFLAYLRKTFSEPRRPLQVLANGAFTINFPGTSQALSDAKQGPFPKSVKVYKIDGATILVDLTIEYYETICPQTGQYLLSNRFAQSVDIDADGYTTLTTTGTIVYNIEKDANRTADFYRNKAPVVYVTADNFRRINQRYSLSSDGTTLTYEIVDQESYQAPPIYFSNNSSVRNGAITRWEGTYSEESDPGSKYGIGVRLATLTLSAWGNRLTPKKVLMTFLVNLIDSRIKKADIIKYYKISENLNESSCSLVVAVYRTSTNDFVDFQGKITKIQIPTTTFGDPVVFPQKFTVSIADDSGALQNTTLTLGPNLVVSDRGTANLQLRIKEVNPTCSDKTGMEATPPFNGATGPNTTPTTQGNPQQPSTKSQFEKTGNSVKQSEDYPYVSCNIEQQIVESESIIQLPKASGGSNECFFARPTQPISKTIVRFRMERLNKQPDLPNPQIAGQTLLRKSVILSEPALLASGVDRLFAIQGEYIFGYDKTAKIGETAINMPKSLTDNYDIPSGVASQLAVGSSSFVPGLIS